MTKHLRKYVLLSCTGIVLTLSIAVFPRVSERGIQSRTNLQVVVTGLKQGGTGRQAVPLVGAMVLAKSQAANHGFEETAPTDARGSVIFADVPYGMIIIQVTAPGWGNYGGPHQLNKREQTINIQLQEDRGGPSPAPTPSPTPTPAFSTRM